MYRDSTEHVYTWFARSSYSVGIVWIYFPGPPTLTNYSCVPDSLHSAPQRCFFMLDGNCGGGQASSGSISVSQGNPMKLSFANISVPGTKSNITVTNTVSGLLPLKY